VRHGAIQKSQKRTFIHKTVKSLQRQAAKPRFSFSGWRIAFQAFPLIKKSQNNQSLEFSRSGNESFWVQGFWSQKHTWASQSPRRVTLFNSLLFFSSRSFKPLGRSLIGSVFARGSFLEIYKATRVAFITRRSQCQQAAKMSTRSLQLPVREAFTNFIGPPEWPLLRVGLVNKMSTSVDTVGARHTLALSR
jgi:hypothetical protein